MTHVYDQILLRGLSTPCLASYLQLSIVSCLNQSVLEIVAVKCSLISLNFLYL